MWSLVEKEDFDKTLSYMKKHSPFTCPMYGNAIAAGLPYRLVAMRSGLYYAYKNEDDEICGIIVGYNDGNVMVHISCESARKNVIKIIAKLPFHSVWGLDGTLPDNKVLSDSANIVLDKRELQVMVMKPEAFNALSNNMTDDVKLIRIDDKRISPQKMSFIRKCLWEGFGFKSNSWDIRKRIKERTKLEPYWFLSHNKKYVAQAHVQAMTPAHGYIGGVCTPRDSRNKGYSKETMYHVCTYIMNEDRIPSLAVAKSNKAAYSLYNNMGFETVGTILVYMQERAYKGDENS